MTARRLGERPRFSAAREDRRDGQRESFAALARFMAMFSVASFVLNWPWEMLQMPAYAEMANRSWRATALPCMLAALGDVALSLTIYGIGALAAGRLGWGMSGRWNVYGASAVLGAVSATAIEQWALGRQRWTYAVAMPIVPVAEVGLWPLLQLAILVPAALWIAQRRQGLLVKRPRHEP